jgi:hypothetical protein
MLYSGGNSALIRAILKIHRNRLTSDSDGAITGILHDSPFTNVSQL